MKYLKIMVLILVFFLCNKETNAQFSFGTYALENVNIIDVNNQKILKDHTILIQGNKIYEIIPSKDYVPNDTVQSLKLTGKFVVPGLIDAHVHFATNPTEERRDNAEKILEEMLRSGITSVRDMAGDARALSGLSRDALIGDIIAPNIYYSSLMAGEEFFSDPRTIVTTQGGKSGEMPYMKAINDSSNISHVVAQAIGTGAKGIKLYANLSNKQILKIVGEATNQKIPVWSHAALLPTKPSQVIASGVISISHSSMLVFEKYTGMENIPKSWIELNSHKKSNNYWDEEYGKLNLEGLYVKMKNNNVILDATMSLKAVFENKDKYHWRYEMSKRITKAAKEAGVKIAAGSDSDQETFIQHEMKLLVNECGFKPIEALIAATKNSAQATGIFKFEGSIEKGKKANLLLLNSNPIETIENIDDIHMVIKNGKLYNPK